MTLRSRLLYLDHGSGSCMSKAARVSCESYSAEEHMLNKRDDTRSFVIIILQLVPVTRIRT